jgi:hypothetical protein
MIPIVDGLQAVIRAREVRVQASEDKLSKNSDNNNNPQPCD